MIGALHASDESKRVSSQRRAKAGLCSSDAKGWSSEARDSVSAFSKVSLANSSEGEETHPS
jgi:hypothetical protein